MGVDVTRATVVGVWNVGVDVTRAAMVGVWNMGVNVARTGTVGVLVGVGVGVSLAPHPAIKRPSSTMMMSASADVIWMSKDRLGFIEFVSSQVKK